MLMLKFVIGENKQILTNPNYQINVYVNVMCIPKNPKMSKIGVEGNILFQIQSVPVCSFAIARNHPQFTPPSPNAY